jgi:hypothetical protein
MDMESKVEIERKRDEEIAQFEPLSAVERRTIIAVLRHSLAGAVGTQRRCWALAKQRYTED